MLEELRGRGLSLIYSTAVVRADLIVTVEPRATDPRAILDEILAPLGLEARDGPGGSVLVLGAGAATPAGALRGRVISAARGAPVIGATISVTGLTARATSGPDGSFDIQEVPAGVYELAVEAPGFLQATLQQVRVGPRGRSGLVVPLEARPSYVAEIVVTPGSIPVVRQEQAPRLEIASEEAVLVPTIGGDISRVIEQMPGVAAPDNSAAFNVRGSTQRDVSLVLDGLELYEPFHLRAFQSPFSVIDSKLIDTIEFIGGGFTAELGDRHGGFVELTTGPFPEDRRGAVELGTLNSRFASGGRIPGLAGSWLASARYWYPVVLRDAIELGGGAVDPRLGDVIGRATFHVSEWTVLSGHALFAWDSLRFEERGGGEEVVSANRNGYVWLRALNAWSPTIHSQTVVSAGRIERRREGLSQPEDATLAVEDDRDVEVLGLKHDASWDIAETQMLRVGLDVRRLKAAYRYRLGEIDDPGSLRSLDPRPAGESYGLYAAHRSAITSRLVAEVGLRWDRQSYLPDSQLSPRLNVAWLPGGRTEMRLAFGHYYQSQRIHELRVEDGETTFQPAELSRQADLTLLHSFGRGPRLRISAYSRRLSRLHTRYENIFNPIELFPETEEDRKPVRAERARLRGVEVLLRSGADRPFVWWGSYTLSSADDLIGNRWVPRSWDQTHAGKFLVGYHRADRWFVSLGGSAHTGWPTTIVTGKLTTPPGGSPAVERVMGPRNAARFPAYVRLDLKASRSFRPPRGRLRLELDVVNLTNRRNVCCVDDVLFELRGDGTIETLREISTWLGFTPSFSALYEF